MTDRSEWEGLASKWTLSQTGRMHAAVAVRKAQEGQTMADIAATLSKLTGKPFDEDHVWNLMMMALTPEERAEVWDEIERLKRPS